MSGNAREGLVGTLRHHIQITLLGALLVLAPLVVLVHTVLRVRTAVDKAVAPLRELLPKSMLSGEGYSVNERVSNDGFLNTYTTETDYGVIWRDRFLHRPEPHLPVGAGRLARTSGSPVLKRVHRRKAVPRSPQGRRVPPR